jgi:hypothetical protein
MWTRTLLLASILAAGALTGCATRRNYSYYDYGRMSPARVRVYGLAPSRGQVWVEEYRAAPRYRYRSAPRYRTYRYGDYYRWR